MEFGIKKTKAMLKAQATQNVIDYHLTDILKQIETNSKAGVRQIKLLHISSDQKRLLEELGYSVDEFDRNFEPLRHSVNVMW